jgi:polyhydroxybutyrate depolymerase
MKSMFGLRWENSNEVKYFSWPISRMVTIFAILLISAFVVNQSAVAQNQPQIQVGENTRSILSGGQTREYVLYIPAGYDEKTPLPLVLLFHAAALSAKRVMELSNLNKLADEKKFIILAPEGIYPWIAGPTWNYRQEPGSINDIEFVKDLIKEIRSNIPIDQKRIYASGYSAGGMLSCRLACELSDVIAAIGLVAAFRCPEECKSTRSISLIAFQGTNDHMLVYSSVQNNLSNWVKNHGCIPTPKVQKISEDVSQLTYSGCKDNSEVVFYRINGGDHDWPDSPVPMNFGKNTKDINASRLLWGFFEKHPLP